MIDPMKKYENFASCLNCNGLAKDKKSCKAGFGIHPELKSFDPENQDCEPCYLWNTWDSTTKEYICTQCGRTVTHPKNPPICDYWFVNGKFICRPCQWKNYQQDCQNRVNKISEQLFGTTK